MASRAGAGARVAALGVPSPPRTSHSAAASVTVALGVPSPPRSSSLARGEGGESERRNNKALNCKLNCNGSALGWIVLDIGLYGEVQVRGVREEGYTMRCDTTCAEMTTDVR
jgi:hypothetical protein